MEGSVPPHQARGDVPSAHHSSVAAEFCIKLGIHKYVFDMRDQIMFDTI